MKIVVLVKQVPDTWGERRLDAASGRIERAASDAVFDEIGERALEVALSYKDRNAAEVMLITMGPASSADMLRHGLAMGADSAVHVLDEDLRGSDLMATAVVLAAAIGTGVDLVIAGNESTDGRGGVVPAMVAELLSLPYLGNLDGVDISIESVRGSRADDSGTVTLSVPMPAVVTVTERSAEPRFPGFKGTMAARKKPVRVITSAELGSSAPTARTVVSSVTKRPERALGVRVVDDGTAAAQLVEFLAAENLLRVGA